MQYYLTLIEVKKIVKISGASICQAYTNITNELIVKPISEALLPRTRCDNIVN